MGVTQLANRDNAKWARPNFVQEKTVHEAVSYESHRSPNATNFPKLDLSVLFSSLLSFTPYLFIMSLNKTELQTPDWLNSGDNAWQLTASSLVALQSIPGLVAIYAGLVKTKWAINSAFMCFYAFAAVMICWGVWGYSMSFGAEMIPGLVGIPKPMLSSMTELTQVRLLYASTMRTCAN
jgi:hypothetical protein